MAVKMERDTRVLKCSATGSGPGTDKKPQIPQMQLCLERCRATRDNTLGLSLANFMSKTDKLKGSAKEPNILIYFFFHPSLNHVLFPMFYLLVEGECQILVF